MTEVLYVFDEDDEYFRDPSGAMETPGALSLRIKLRRGAAVGGRVCLFPDGGEGRETELEFLCVSGAFDVYGCTLEFETPGLYWYRFLVRKSDGGMIAVPEQAGGAFQITMYGPEAITPDWIKGGFIYHVFVDRFRRGGEPRPRQGSEYRSDWGGCPRYLPDSEGIVRNNDFFGGDLYGIIEKLPYLVEMGVTCIYLSPVFEAASNHKYDTGDYMKIDSAFGGDEAFRRLCFQAGKLGIRIILDGVFNHVGRDSRYFNRYGNYDGLGAYQGAESPYYDWFTFREDGKYDSWWGIKLLPAINESSESYREFICGEEGVIAHWTKEGVSGWRLDVVDELPDVFLYPLCEAMRRERGDALIIGEVWEDASTKTAYDVRRRYFLGGQLDGVTNYPLKDAIINFAKQGGAEQIAQVMATLYRNYPKHICHALMNILGTHDTVRILTALSDAELPRDKRYMENFRLDEAQRAIAKRRLKLASTLQFTLPGVPCVYYGDEAGMEGCADPFNRRCYPWGSEDAELVGWYKNMSRLRKAHSCFATGAYELVEARAGLFAFIRGTGEERVLVAANASDSDRTPKADGFNFNLLTGEKTDALTVKAGEPAIFAIV